jgi:hypothetical protein
MQTAGGGGFSDCVGERTFGVQKEQFDYRVKVAISPGTGALFNYCG